MFKPVSLYIGLRYTRAKRRSHFISFISLVSMLGITLGVAVLITVLSINNGFDYQIRNKIFNMARQVMVHDVTGKLSNWRAVEKQVAGFPDVTGVAPLVDGQGMLSSGGQVMPVMVVGILPSQNKNVSQIASKVVAGSMSKLQSGKFNIVIGQALAEQLGVGIGDKITVVTPQANFTPIGISARFKRFTVEGIFHVSAGFGYDKSIAFINMHDAQKLYLLGNNVTGLRVRVNNLYVAPKVANALQMGLNIPVIVSNWTQQFQAFFRALKLQKTMFFFILLLIIAVAAFNLVSTLVMVVTDKRAEIAILRTLGASPKMIMATFMVQGVLVGTIGTVFGVMGGVVLSWYVTPITNFIERIFHVQFIQSSVYFINYLPSKLEWSDVMHVGIYALLMSLVATLYPAWQASRTQPAEALRYE